MGANAHKATRGGAGEEWIKTLPACLSRGQLALLWADNLTLFDLQSGREVAMPGAYDEMSDRSYINYRGGTTAQRRARDLLRAAMEA